MSGDRTIIPTNLMSWPRVENLLPDQKLIVYALWANRFQNCCGCFQLPLSMFSVSVSIKERAVEDALQEFKRRELVDMDDKTGEIYVLDWLRFHTFRTGKSLAIYWKQVDRVQSERLREVIHSKSALFNLTREKSDSYSPNNNTNYINNNTNINKARPGESWDEFKWRTRQECGA